MITAEELESDKRLVAAIRVAPTDKGIDHFAHRRYEQAAVRRWPDYIEEIKILKAALTGAYSQLRDAQHIRQVTTGLGRDVRLHRHITNDRSPEILDSIADSCESVANSIESLVDPIAVFRYHTPKTLPTPVHGRLMHEPDTADVADSYGGIPRGLDVLFCGDGKIRAMDPMDQSQRKALLDATNPFSRRS